MVFTEREEEILKLMINEIETKTSLTNHMDKFQVDNLPLQNAHTIASIALKDKVKELETVIPIVEKV